MANILIVDSYSAVSSLYCEVLKEYGHCVYLAESGRKALLIALYKTIDIAIVDDTLPDFSADEVFTRLKQLQPHVRGILTVSSAFGPSPDTESWEEQVIKSADFSLLEAEVNKLAAISRCPSHISSSVQNYNLFLAPALESEEHPSSTETKTAQS